MNQDIYKINKIYEGKAKIIYDTNDNDHLIQYFKDDVTAFNNIKKSQILGKGKLNNNISSYIMNFLSKNNIDNHYIDQISDREQLVKKVKIINLEIIVRNYAAGSICKRLGLAKSLKFKNPLFEICYKNDDLSDPLITKDHATHILELITDKEYDYLQNISLKINKLLIKLFNDIDIKLVDFKLEFGYFNGKIILADEISPDSCRLWDKNSSKIFDKDLFRNDLGDLSSGYQEVWNRIKNISKN